jgi:hypothetical protein
MTIERYWEVTDINHTSIVPTGLTKVVVKIIDLLILPTFDRDGMIDTKDRYLWECIREDCKNKKRLTLKRFYTLLSHTTMCREIVWVEKTDEYMPNSVLFQILTSGGNNDVFHSGFKLGNPGVFIVSLDVLEFSN